MLDRFDRLGQFARNVWSTPPTPDAPPETPTSDPAVISMLRALGVAMLETGQATNTVGETLDRIAAANGAIELRAIVLPTVIIIQAAGSRQLIEVEEAHGHRVRLDQAGSVATLVGIAERAEMAPADVVTAVARVRARGPRFGPAVTILGHGVLALGFGLQLRPTLAAVPAYLVLGLLVGTLTVVAVRLPTVATALPVVAAFVVTWVTGSFLADIVDEERCG